MKREFKAYIPKMPLKKDFTGYGQNIFVGRYGYPNVNLGYLSTENKGLLADKPTSWVQKKYDIDKIMDVRMGILNSRIGVNVKDLSGRKVDDAKLLSQSINNPKIDVSLKKMPAGKLYGAGFAPPYGGAADLQKLRIDENPRIPKKIQSLVDDNQVTVEQSLKEMGYKKFDEHYISSLLSSGSLGIHDQRKMVPTRWSITATDDTLAKIYLREVKNYDCTSPLFFEGGYLGNYYLVFFLPGAFCFELFEIELSKGSVWHDYELETGRKSYARETVGGYYAARLGILEYMKHKKIQARALVFRYVTEEYYQHLGVWVVREAVRAAMKQKPQIFETNNIKQLLIEESKKYGYYAGLLLAKSVLLKQGSQKRLTMF